MPSLATYVLTTGAIVGVWTAAELALLMANVVADDPTYGYLVFEDLDPRLVQEQYEVVDDELVARTETVITATPNPFPDDGVTPCAITVDPFVQCTLLVGTDEIVLTTGDPVLNLLCDSPQILEIRLLPVPGYWAAPILVEAA